MKSVALLTRQVISARPFSLQMKKVVVEVPPSSLSSPLIGPCSLANKIAQIYVQLIVVTPFVILRKSTRNQRLLGLGVGQPTGKAIIE